MQYYLKIASDGVRRKDWAWVVVETSATTARWYFVSSLVICQIVNCTSDSTNLVFGVTVYNDVVSFSDTAHISFKLVLLSQVLVTPVMELYLLYKKRTFNYLI